VFSFFSQSYPWQLTCFSQEKLTKEIEELRAKSAARRATRDKEESVDMSILDEAGAVTVPSVIVA
jgi:hypothetical protein